MLCHVLILIALFYLVDRILLPFEHILIPDVQSDMSNVFIAASCQKNVRKYVLGISFPNLCIL
jgi:hypothetical protein